LGAKRRSAAHYYGNLESLSRPGGAAVPFPDRLNNIGDMCPGLGNRRTKHNKKKKKKTNKGALCPPTPPVIPIANFIPGHDPLVCSAIYPTRSPQQGRWRSPPCNKAVAFSFCEMFRGARRDKTTAFRLNAETRKPARAFRSRRPRFSGRGRADSRCSVVDPSGPPPPRPPPPPAPPPPPPPPPPRRFTYQSTTRWLTHRREPCAVRHLQDRRSCRGHRLTSPDMTRKPEICGGVGTSQTCAWGLGTNGCRRRQSTDAACICVRFSNPPAYRLEIVVLTAAEEGANLTPGSPSSSGAGSKTSEPESFEIPGSSLSRRPPE